MMDRETGRARGFGFVSVSSVANRFSMQNLTASDMLQYGSDAEAQAAIDGLNGQDLVSSGLASINAFLTFLVRTVARFVSTELLSVAPVVAAEATVAAEAVVAAVRLRA